MLLILYCLMSQLMRAKYRMTNLCFQRPFGLAGPSSMLTQSKFKCRSIADPCQCNCLNKMLHAIISPLSLSHPVQLSRIQPHRLHGMHSMLPISIRRQPPTKLLPYDGRKGLLTSHHPHLPTRQTTA